MRISDWSSDVCSSDLPCVLGNGNEDFRRNQSLGRMFPARQHFKAIEAACPKVDLLLIIRHELTKRNTFTHARFQAVAHVKLASRSAERRVVNAGVGTCRYRWGLSH